MEYAVPYENDEQMTVIQWARANRHLYKELELLHHIPNGGKRGEREAARLKAQGVKAGVPDLCLPVPRGGYHGLYIEMKRREHGTVSEHQKKWLKALHEQGYCVSVCRGADEAIRLIEMYLLHKLRADETNIYDVVEEHHNCFVQVLRNSATGEESIGWREE